MRHLHAHRLRTGKRITIAVREAVAAYVASHIPDAIPDPEPHDLTLISEVADGAR